MAWLKQSEAGINPTGKFTYQGKAYPVWSSFEAHYKPEDSELGKFNRYAKLGLMADKTVQLFKTLVQKDPLRVEARLAYACLLMLQHGLRVGNEDSAEGYESQLPANLGEFVQTYGVTTLLPEHVTVQRDKLILHFLGKKQVEQNIKVEDPMLVVVGQLYRDNPGATWIGIDLGDLTRFIKDHFGPNFVPKDLRSFFANVTAFDLMRPYLDEAPVMKQDANKELKLLVGGVATGLGNTPAVAKGSYLDARMLEWYVNRRTNAPVVQSRTSAR
jgi:DNA topoisomerase IB